MKTKKYSENLSIFKVSWPIFCEMLLMMLLGNVDVLMLSQYSDVAVAAVGVSNQLVMMSLMLFGFVSVGASVVCAQYIGAKKADEAKNVVSVALVANLLLGLFVSGIYVLFRFQFLRLMGVADEVIGISGYVLGVVGGFVFIQALLSVTGAVLRSHGYTKDMLFITLLMNVFNVIGNAIVIFGFFGLPVLGVTGVAWVTVASKLIGLLLGMVVLAKRIPNVFKGFRKINRYSSRYLKQIFKIGLPAASEGLSFSGYQLVVTALVATLGTTALTTQIYARSVNFFILLLASATGQGSAIIIAQLMGAKKYDEIYSRCLKYLKFGLFASGIGGVLLFLFYRPILTLFTDDEQIIGVARQLFFIGIFLEIGRAANMVIIGGLRATGDAKFPALMAVIFMWLCGAFGAFFFGIVLGFGLPGILIGSMLDECVRGIIMFFRWQSRAWVKKSVIH